MKSHPPTQPLGNHGICHYVRADFLRSQLPPARVQAARLDSVLFYSVIEYRTAIAGVDSKSVTCQHKIDLHLSSRAHGDERRCPICIAERKCLRADSTARNSVSSWLRLVPSLSSMICPPSRSRFFSKSWICSPTRLCIVHIHFRHLGFTS